jgi:hypothetical protein
MAAPRPRLVANTATREGSLGRPSQRIGTVGQ